MLHRRSRCGLVLACVLLIGSDAIAVSQGANQDSGLFDQATGYRIERYRAPVNAEAPGVKRVDIAGVETLIAKGVVLLDVMASDGAGLDGTTGVWRMAKPRDHIPGSVWLPDVGKGRLEAHLDAYFKSNLKRLTGGDKERAVLIYCQADCWMGWNAAKRAASYGYSSIFWYPDGIDGWREWNQSVAPAVPVPVALTQEVDTRRPF